MLQVQSSNSGVVDPELSDTHPDQTFRSDADPDSSIFYTYCMSTSDVFFRINIELLVSPFLLNLMVLIFSPHQLGLSS